MRVYSYVVKFDTGFAPNPFWGALTLACCKPKIRKHAAPGDLIVGLTGAGGGNRVVFVAYINEKLTFNRYWADKRFRATRPDISSSRRAKHHGDNIYEPMSGHRFRQLPSKHSNGEVENEGNRDHDLNGRAVLVAHDFSYFGGDAIRLPKRFADLIVGRAHKCRFPDTFVKAVDRWRQKLPKGVLAAPQLWRDHDTSWKRCS